MNQLKTEAKTENLEIINDFLAENLIGCPMKLLMQTQLAVEEIFVNIAHYAYKDKTGDVNVLCELDKEKNLFTIIFEDTGIPFDPLKRDDPDVTATAEERDIGGLGIFLTKKLMDEVSYENKDGKNILTLIKKI
ncbi:MAG: ATP-binding protein [Firmicutes bacterium]|nr:ATP-binding protein [Bacillota bacterium]